MTACAWTAMLTPFAPGVGRRRDCKTDIIGRREVDVPGHLAGCRVEDVTVPG